MLPYRIIEHRLQEAVLSVLPGVNRADVLVRPCPEPKFGDYQSTSLMALAKQRKLNPRQVAQDVLSRVELPEWIESAEIAGAGFLNFRLKPDILCHTLEAAARGEHLFLEKTPAPRTVVVDFSSPNVAKSMHVGHIRSTILGDVLARILRFLGHRVITDNHIGDWGTQFGKLILGWKAELDARQLERNPIAEMERLYKKTNSACESDQAVLEKARVELVKLQKNDPENLAIWRQMIALSQEQFDAVYARMGIRFDHALGESFYNPQLGAIVDDLRKADLARESEGAVVVFFEEDPELKGHPAIVQKSDGAANYTTTDLATLQYRLETWDPDEILYVTDGRQQLHFKQLFAIFRKWRPNSQVKLAHVWFGAILGEDGKPFRTRSGETIKLSDLLDEAEERALAVVSEKNPQLDEAAKREIARAVGLGAVKYADLLPNRQSDYVFSWDKMLALNGNTAPYLQYAHARIQSIFRKLKASGEELSAGRLEGSLELTAPEEIVLVKHFLNFGLILEAVAADYRPNYLCNYLYELANHFTRFYENCPVLKAEPPAKQTRLVLCEMTGRLLQTGLGLLGIEAPNRM